MRASQMDQRTMAEAFSFPGIDPRAWVSYAIVETVQAETENPVDFDDDDGQVYVNCILKPTNIPCRARTGGMFAGPGEGVYSPFVGGEEVLVAIPEGDVKGGCVILTRLNNGYDGFPQGSVAGKDANTNTFSMMRTRPALTIESGASIMLRSASLGAMLQLAGTGAVTIRDGAANVLQMSADVFGYQNADGTIAQQIDLNASRFTLAVGNVLLTLSGDTAQASPQSLIQVPSTLTLSAAGATMNNAVEHVTTTEATSNVLTQYTTSMAAAQSAAFAAGAAAAAGAGEITLANILTTLSTVFAALGGPIPVAAAITAAGVATQAQEVAVAIAATFAASTAKPIGVPGLGQLKPGIGSVGVLTG
jgi:hypothetical protein